MGATIVKMDKNVSKIFDIKIRPYSDDDMLVLEKTLGDPSQMIHLNGPENHERLERRHEEYVRMSIDPIAGCMYTIIPEVIQGNYQLQAYCFTGLPYFPGTLSNQVSIHCIAIISHSRADIHSPSLRLL